MSAHDLNVVVEAGEGARAARVVVTGDLDLCSAPRLRAALCRTLAEASGPVDVDLSGVTFFSCAGLDAVLDGAATAPGRLRIIAVSPSILDFAVAAERTGGPSGGTRVPRQPR